ncbi:MAG: TetR/AcrR family transcriptional regulator [Ruminococcus sp.]|nr:TetR/AcrR family transcriptional regulator [Ruminococcus sp.]
MGTDGETRERLIESAKKEFLEKGYMKASLRKICADAGVTTGALYFFFKDKEALFGAIVETPLQKLLEYMQMHFEEDSGPKMLREYEHKDGDHDAFTSMLVHHLYSNYDAFLLILTKAQGTRYEDCVDRIVDMTERTYLAMAENMASIQEGMKVNQYMTHWLTHMHIDAFIHLLTHEPDEACALRQMRRIMDFFVHGFVKMALVPDDED